MGHISTQILSTIDRKECLLSITNERFVNGSKLGDRIAQSSHEHLWAERTSQAKVDTIVIHYISAINSRPDEPYNLDAIMQIFCDYGVSSHFLIERDGQILDLVPITKKAWHCGGSIMPDPDNRTNVNEFSIGIELVATSKSGFSVFQYMSLVNLCIMLEAETGTKMSYVGHEHIAGERAVSMGLRKDAKTDPGPIFDWEYFQRLLKVRGSGWKCIA